MQERCTNLKNKLPFQWHLHTVVLPRAFLLGWQRVSVAIFHAECLLWRIYLECLFAQTHRQSLFHCNRLKQLTRGGSSIFHFYQLSRERGLSIEKGPFEQHKGLSLCINVSTMKCGCLRITQRRDTRALIQWSMV